MLKIDIEWAEYPSLTQLARNYSAASVVDFPIGQMMIEIHIFAAKNMNTGRFLKWYIRFLTNIYLASPSPSLSLSLSSHSRLQK
jgi:hypothetical protein